MRRKKSYQKLRRALARVQGVTEPEVTTRKSKIKERTERYQENESGMISNSTEEEMKQMCREKSQTVTKNKIRSWKRQADQLEPKTSLDRGNLSQKG